MKKVALLAALFTAPVVVAACGGEEGTPTLVPPTPVPPTPSPAPTVLELLEEGETTLSTILETAEDDLTALHQRGFARLAQEKYSEALTDFERKLELDPQFPDAWLGKALALIGLGRVGEAGEALDIAIALDPNNSDAIEARQALEQIP
ncbi:MAG: tetratricopeptide repeat protein [Dehalococcoidia bacterium]